MREEIDALRDLLGLHDRTVMSMRKLEGTVETTEFGEVQRSFAPNGDVAFVFVGPASLIEGERRGFGVDGAVTYRFTLKPSRDGDGPDVVDFGVDGERHAAVVAGEVEGPVSFVWLGENLQPGIRVAVLSPDGVLVGEMHLESVIPHFPAASPRASFRLVFEWQT